MGRKFNSTEISGNVNIQSNGQHMKANFFCINCNAIGTTEKHYPNCSKHESYAIPSTAEVPKKNASKRKWKVFKDQFVYAKVVGWWFYYEQSWWYKNNSK